MQRNSIVTHGELATVIAQTGPDRDAAEQCARVLLDRMFPLNRCLDNHLSKEERSLMYDLQDLGVVAGTGYHTELPRGGRWEIREWYIKADVVAKVAQEAQEVEEESVYDELPKGVWARA